MPEFQGGQDVGIPGRARCPPHNNTLVEQASCLLLIPITMPEFQGGQDAHPTITLNSCGTGILPVANSNY